MVKILESRDLVNQGNKWGHAPQDNKWDPHRREVEERVILSVDSTKMVTGKSLKMSLMVQNNTFHISTKIMMVMFQKTKPPLDLHPAKGVNRSNDYQSQSTGKTDESKLL